MANEQGGAGGQPSGAQPGGEQGGGGASGAAEDIQRQFNDAVARLSGPGEPLIALGAILLAFVDIFGEIIFDEWSIGYYQLIPAYFAIGAIVMFRFMNRSLPVNFTLLLVILGLISGVTEVREIIWYLQNSFFDYDTSSIIFGLIEWAGGILMLLGAIQLWPSVTRAS
jgi:hypothetical protein